MKRATAMTMGTSAIVSVLTVIVGIATARILGPADRGLYTTVVVATSLVSMLVTLGFGEVLVIHSQQSGSGRSYRRATWQISGAASILLAAPLLPYLAGVLPLDAKRATLAIAACVVGALGTLGLADQVARGAFGASNLIRTAPVVTQAVVFGSIWVAGLPVSLDLALLLYVLTILVPAAIALALLRVGRRRPTQPSVGLRGTFKVVAPIWMGRVAQVISTRVDLLTLAYLAPAHVVAQYAIALSTALAATSVSASVSLLMLRDARSSATVGSAATAVGLGSTIAVALIGPFAVALLYGPEYSAAASLVPLAALLAFTQLLHDLTMRLLLRVGYTATAGIASGVLTGLHAIALVVLVPTVGLAGGLVALTINQALVLLGAYLATHRRDPSPDWSSLSPLPALRDVYDRTARRRGTTRSRIHDALDSPPQTSPSTVRQAGRGESSE